MNNVYSLFGKSFSILLIGLSAAASVAYFFAGDYRRAIYWAAAAIIAATVTF